MTIDTKNIVADKNAKKELLKERPAYLYMRKWKILIYKPAYKKDSSGKQVRDPEHDTAVDVSSLRCVFKTQQKGSTAAPVLCTLAVYNMNAQAEGEIIKEGFKLSIEGGYMEGQYGEVFSGDILQVFRNRENGVDYRLEIVAVKGAPEFFSNHVRSKLAAGSSPREVIAAVAKNSKKKIEVGEISKNLSKQTLPRAKIFFGTPNKYLRNVCIGNNAFYRADEGGKLTVKKVEDEIPADKVLDLTPKDSAGNIKFCGLVGIPTYSDDGIHIKTLLDPRIKFMTLLKINNNLIQLQAMNFDLDMKALENKKQVQTQTPQTAQIDKDGEYQVFSIEHSGDTFGDEWFTSVVAVSRTGANKLAIMIDGRDTLR